MWLGYNLPPKGGVAGLRGQFWNFGTLPISRTGETRLTFSVWMEYVTYILTCQRQITIKGNVARAGSCDQFLQGGRMACNAERCISNGNSVRLSVTRFSTRSRWMKMRSSLWGIANTRFLIPTMVEATSPSTKNLRSKWPTPLKSADFDQLSAYNVSTERASEISSIIANRSVAR